MDHITSATTAFPAVAGKCISGFETRCSCGLVMRSSLIGIALADVREHLAWAAKQPRKAR